MDPLRAAQHLPFPLIAAKVTPPVARPGSVTRTALVDRLCARRNIPVVTVIAPAGYGKSTLLRQWADHDPRPFTWLTLDARDNDPAVLLTYLAVALDQIVGVDPAVFRSVSAPRNTTSAALARVLQALEQGHDSAVLVLDDVHTIDAHACLDLLAGITARVPLGWQVVLAGRERPPLPVARLRAEGRIVELWPTDLAMNDEEAGEMLAAAAVDLRPDAVVALNEQVEGWAAALYLAALAITSEPAVDPGTAAEVGRGRFVMDYVQSEVLSRLPPDDVEFLMRTSVLDRLTGPLCDAVLGASGSAARLEVLEKTNRLVTPLDHTGTWYRCHHVLRDLLRAELQRREPDRIAALRRRAADWYQANDLPDLAIDQAMAIGDADRVATITEAWGRTFYRRGRAVTTRRWFEWIEAHDRIATRPALALTGALVHMVDGRPAAAERWLDAAQRGVTHHDIPTLRGQAAMLRALACRDGVETALRDGEEGVALVALDDPYRALSLLVLGMLCRLTDQPERAHAVLSDAVEVAEDSLATPTLTVALALCALLALRDGRADSAQALAERACAVVDDAGLDDYGFSALVYAATARIRIELGAVAIAKNPLLQAQRLQAHLSHSLPFYTVQTRLELARCYLALTDVSGARAMLREALKVVRRRPQLGGLVVEIAELQAQLDALHANMAGASSLTAAELRLLPLLATHLSFREIGQRLFISPNTVKTEAISIYRKLGVSSRSAAIDRAHRLGLLVA